MLVRPRRLSLAGLDVRLEFLQFRRVLTGMMLAEQQFATGLQDCSDACGSAAPIATVGSGQLRAGKRAGHDFSFRLARQFGRTRSNYLSHSRVVPVNSYIESQNPTVADDRGA